MVALAAAENVRVLAVDPSEEACRKAACLQQESITGISENTRPAW